MEKIKRFQPIAPSLGGLKAWEVHFLKDSPVWREKPNGRLGASFTCSHGNSWTNLGSFQLPITMFFSSFLMRRKSRTSLIGPCLTITTPQVGMKVCPDHHHTLQTCPGVPAGRQPWALWVATYTLWKGDPCSQFFVVPSLIFPFWKQPWTVKCPLSRHCFSCLFFIY